jgi:nicotinamidase-related amidase
MKAALLVIDMQKAFQNSSPVTAESYEQAIPQINAAIDLFREQQLPVISIQHIEEEYDVVPGTRGFEVIDELKILDTDLHIHKTYGNAFNKTPLQAELNKLGVDTLILSGYCAEYCVLSTYRGAQDVDLRPLILSEALASDDPQNIPFVQRVNQVIGYESLKEKMAE